MDRLRMIPMLTWIRRLRGALAVGMIVLGLLGYAKRHDDSTQEINRIYEMAWHRNMHVDEPETAWVEVAGLAKTASDHATQDTRLLDTRLRILIAAGCLLLCMECIIALLRSRQLRSAASLGSSRFGAGKDDRVTVYSTGNPS